MQHETEMNVNIFTHTTAATRLTAYSTQAPANTVHAILCSKTKKQILAYNYYLSWVIMNEQLALWYRELCSFRQGVDAS